MAKFDAGAAVESMEYDFSAFGGSMGTIPEPSTLKVNNFFEEMRALFKEARAAQAANDAVDIEELSDEEMADAIEGMDEKMALATDSQRRTIEAVAVLCGGDRNDDGVVVGGTPSVDDLQSLPYRALTKFNQWLIREISPKSEQEETASRPATKDRQRAGASRKRKS